jgi:hypothetical protein
MLLNRIETVTRASVDRHGQGGACTLGAHKEKCAGAWNAMLLDFRYMHRATKQDAGKRVGGGRSLGTRHQERDLPEKKLKTKQKGAKNDKTIADLSFLYGGIPFDT